MRLSDPALADRLKVIPCREIPETDRDPGLKAAFEEEGDTLVRQALLSRLVRSACRYRKGMPTIPPEVVATTERVRAESMSPAERWLEERLHPQPGQRLSTVSTGEAWAIWCAHCKGEVTDPGKRTSFVDALKRHCGISTLTRFKLKGKVVQGVRGWALRDPRLHGVARVSGTPLREPSLKRLCENGATSCNRSGNPPENRPEPAQELDAAPAELPGEDHRSFRAPGPLRTPGDETLWETLLMVVFHQERQEVKNLIYGLNVEDITREIREDIEAAAANGVELPSCPTAQGKVSASEIVSWIRTEGEATDDGGGRPVDDDAEPRGPGRPPRSTLALVHAGLRGAGDRGGGATAGGGVDGCGVHGERPGKGRGRATQSGGGEGAWRGDCRGLGASEAAGLRPPGPRARGGRGRPVVGAPPHRGACPFFLIDPARVAWLRGGASAFDPPPNAGCGSLNTPGTAWRPESGSPR